VLHLGGALLIYDPPDPDLPWYPAGLGGNGWGSDACCAEGSAAQRPVNTVPCYRILTARISGRGGTFWAVAPLGWGPSALGFGERLELLSVSVEVFFERSAT